MGRRLEDLPQDWAQRYLATLHDWMHLLDPSKVPPIDMFPFLKWVPSRFAAWKGHAKHARDGLSEAYMALVDYAHQSEKDATSGQNFESLVERLLRQNQAISGEGAGLSRRDIAFIVGGVLDGAFDTTYHMSLTLLKTLAAYPAVQKHLQDELDDVWYDPTLLRPPGYNILRTDLDLESLMMSTTQGPIRWSPD